jgi:type I restriction enzyme S subunit
LPPRTEQDRIVAKVDYLMAICDDLEAKLKQSEQDGERLMTATVGELVA